MNTLYMPNQYNYGYRGIPDNEDRHFALPLLAGLAITAPFWAGGFRRCCPPYYPAPYPVPYPYYPYPYPSPYYYYNRRPFVY